MAEISSLLGLITDEHTREVLIAKMEHMFDAAEDEQKLISDIGSPTKVAVALIRYADNGVVTPEAAAVIDSVTEADNDEQEDEFDTLEALSEQPELLIPESEAETPVEEPEAAPEAEVPAEEPEAAPEAEVPAEEPEAAPEAEAPVEEPEAAPEAEVPAEDAPAPEAPDFTPDTDPDPEAPEFTPDTAPAPEAPEFTPDTNPDPEAPEFTPDTNPDPEAPDEEAETPADAEDAAGFSDAENGEAAPAEDEEARKSAADDADEPPEDEFPPEEDESEEDESEEDEPLTITKVNTFLAILYFIIPGLVIGLPVFLVLVVLNLAFLVVAAAVITAAVLLVLTGLAPLGLPDRLLCFGGAAAALAVGLVLLWFTIWFLICVTCGWVRLMTRGGKRFSRKEVEIA